MKFVGSSSTPIADATTPGSLSVIAQVIAGVKTFTSAIVASVGIQLAALWNTNGAGSSDVCLKVGTSTADASVNAGAKLLSVRTGIGGTEVERLALTTSGMTVQGGTTTYGRFEVNYGSYNFFEVDYGLGWCRAIRGLQTNALAVLPMWPFNSPPAVVLYSDNAGTTKTSELTAAGHFESHVAGAGVILQSPDGTRYKVTVANGGALSVVAA